MVISILFDGPESDPAEQFSAASSNDPVTEAEKALRDWRIRYAVQHDGTIIVPGDIDLAGKSLTELPELSDVVVKGDFLCYYNRIKSLKGSPRKIEGVFDCRYNPDLECLEHAPTQCTEIKSDFGVFKGWETVPNDLRLSDATKAAMAEEERKRKAGYPLEHDIPAVARFKIIKKKRPPVSKL